MRIRIRFRGTRPVAAIGRHDNFPANQAGALQGSASRTILRHSTNAADVLPSRSLRFGNLISGHRLSLSAVRRRGSHNRVHPPGSIVPTDRPGPLTAILRRPARCTAPSQRLPGRPGVRCKGAFAAVVPPSRSARCGVPVRSLHRPVGDSSLSPFGGGSLHRMLRDTEPQRRSDPNTKQLAIQFADPIHSGSLPATANPAVCRTGHGRPLPSPVIALRPGERGSAGDFRKTIAGHRRCEQRTASLSQGKACDEERNADQCAATGRKPDCHH